MEQKTKLRKNKAGNVWFMMGNLTDERDGDEQAVGSVPSSLFAVN